MTNFERMKNMSSDELANFLNKVTEDRPWDNSFDQAYCKKCELINKNGMDYCYCELNGKCKFLEGELTPITAIDFWLSEESED